MSTTPQEPESTPQPPEPASMEATREEKSQARVLFERLRDVENDYNILARIETFLTPILRITAQLREERDALRVAFSEASHNAGPAFVAHEELNRLRDENERLTKERDEARACGDVEAGCHDETLALVKDLRAQLATATTLAETHRQSRR